MTVDKSFSNKLSIH